MQLFNRNGVERKPNAGTPAKPVFIAEQNCMRCGGAGGAEAWKHTGWTCYRCGGNGRDPNRIREKLYTVDELEKLNERRTRLRAKKQAERDAAAAVEQARRDAEREEVISANSGFLARIDAELAHGEHELLRSVRDRIAEQAKDPTDRQLEVVNGIIARNEAERARRAAARHVGSIKERREFTLTLLYCRSEQTGQFPTIWSHWSLFTDENGCKIASKSAPWVLGLKSDRDGYPKGQTIRVKATVTDHKLDKNGEPVTYINRPKGI